MSSLRFQEARTRTFVAGADLSAKKFHAVKLDTVFNEILIAGAGEGFGILQNAPLAGEMAEVAMIGGGAGGHAGATIAIGVELAADSVGRLIPAVSTNRVVGLALQDALVDEYFEVERVFYIKA